MDPELAKKLFHEGAILVILDVPQGTEFGIDYNSWTVGPKFKGVKMIPPGFHFVFYSAVSKDKETAPRTGFLHFFKQKDLVVRRWNKDLEVISTEGIFPEDVERIRAGLMVIDSSLGAYPYESLKKWVSLSNYISEGLVTQVQPLNGYVSSVTELLSEKNAPTSGQSEHPMELSGEDGPQAKAKEVVPESKEEKSCLLTKEKKEGEGGGMFAGVGYFPEATNKEAAGSKDSLTVQPKPESVLRFHSVSTKYPKDCTPEQVTHHSMDCSYTLEDMLKNCFTTEDELLGELQLAFLCFLQGQVYDAFEHWKSLVSMLCSCEDAMKTRTSLFSNFISVLHFQLKEVPEDFFVDIVSRSNFLTTTLQTFFSILEESKGSMDAGLVRKGLKFRESLNKQFKWDFSSQPDEYTPTVVDT